MLGLSMERGLSTHQPRYKVDQIPETFMCSDQVCTEIQDTIHRLHQRESGQVEIDGIYESFKEILKSEMDNNLPSRVITGSRSGRCRRYRPNKQYWTAELTDLFHSYKAAEDTWCACRPNTARKSHLRQLYLDSRKLFDRKRKQAK